MPKRVVSAFYNFRDVTGSAQDIGVPVGSENASRLGGNKRSDRQRKRAESSLLFLSKARNLSSSASRRFGLLTKGRGGCCVARVRAMELGVRGGLE